MSAWARRNTMPIVIVLVASAIVIAGFEFLDSLATSEPLEVAEAEAALNVGGLIKVALFLAVPGAITLALRGRRSAS